MSNSLRVQTTSAFTLHAICAGVFVVLVLFMGFRDLFSPIDVFVHHSYFFYGLLRFAVLGFVFYGFSLALLRICLLSTLWGGIYAVSSWVFLVVAFYPTLPIGSSGMMRRVAGSPADYEVAQQALEYGIRLFGASAVVGFGIIQASFLWFAFRHLRFGATARE